jgi:alpha-galactosidase
MSSKWTTPEEMQIAKNWIGNALGIGPVKPTAVIECRTQGWGTLQFGQSISNGPLRLNGKEFSNGLGTHAPSEIVIKASTPVKKFCAFAGVDDNTQTRAAAIKMIFSVEVKGKEIWTSGPLAVSDAPAKVDLDLGGVQEFVLKAREVNNTMHLAHANWADAKIFSSDGVEATLGAEGFFPAPPVAFRYDGKSSFETLSTWKKQYEKSSLDKGITLHRVTYTEPATGLECILEMKEFSDFPAAEWVVRFKNTGKKDTPILEDIQPLDLTYSGFKAPRLCHSFGSNCRIDDFLYMEKPIEAGKKIRLASGGGRSAENYLPFFNIADADTGFVTAIGWTGQWAAEFINSSGNLQVKAGMEKTHLKLLPGEEIRTPSMLLLFWKGQTIRANNLLRRFILQHHTYRPDGKTIPTPITCAHWGGMKSKGQLDRVKVIKDEKLDYDYYWIDAGWYGPADSYSPDEFTGDWAIHVGNWHVNPAAHPNGLKPISDAAHEAGIKFLLWFEPERAIYGTPLSLEHPDWFLGDKTPNNTLLFNLGNPVARKWFIDFMCGLVKEHGVDCYRQDFNMSPLPFWQANDAPDRQGISEIRHIEGLYEFWDELLRRNPGLIIDNCASGGRRIDLETTGRSIPLWRSDVQCWPNFDPTAGQVHTFGLVHWVPCSTTGNHMRPSDTYNFRSAMCTGVQFGLFGYERNKIDPNYPYDWQRKMIADQRRATPYFLGDFYPLISCSTSAEEWMAYQMHRDDLNEGLVMAFRRPESPFISGSFKLNVLNPKAVYILEDADTGTTWECDGKSLASEGVEITIENPRGSRLIFYREK